MTEAMDDLELRIERLRIEVRRAAMSGEPLRARELRVELRRAERAWDDALDAASGLDEEAPRSPVTLSVREQVHQVLTLLTVPSSPKLIAAVSEGLFGGDLLGPQLTSLRRDEERSFRSSPHARPFYLCGALTADRLVAARGLVAVSTWPLPRRIVGSLSARVDFLTAASRLAEHVGRLATPTLPAARLLWQFAANIPDAATSLDNMRPAVVATAAQAELSIHYEADNADRVAAAERARTQLDERYQLFGSSLKAVPHAVSER